MKLRVVPLTRDEANELVERLHRHHPRVIGHRFALGLRSEDGELHGAVIVGRPVARLVDARAVAEVTRLVTDGTPNACSMLYGAAARVAREMGYQRIQTYILESEPGTSLRASGWRCEGSTGEARPWSHSRERSGTAPVGSKVRYALELRP